MYSQRFLALLSGAILLLIFSACEKREYQSIEELDNQNINDYIRQNNLNVQQYKHTDLFYEVIRPGTGHPLSFEKTYPMVYTISSLDGTYAATDTFSTNNRYHDFLGYFPFGSGAAGIPNSPVERMNDLKYVVRDILGNSDGQIRILVPSRLTPWGRQGNRTLGIPPNASLDYVISVHDNVGDYEDAVIRNAIVNAGFTLDQFEKTSDDIYYRILQAGTGDVITADSIITVDYTLRDPAGDEIESGENVRMHLAGGTITAFTKMMPLIRKGGKIRFFTPSKFAYGTQGSGSVAQFLSLDFEVEIKEATATNGN